jgi:hypothetical protein
MPKSLLYVPTQSLDVNYIFNSKAEDASVVIPGSENHALLYAGYRDLLPLRDSMGYTKNIKGINFATASVTFLYTDTDTEEGLGEDIEWQTFNLNTNYSDRVLSCKDLYDEPYCQKDVADNKAIRDKNFVFHLSQRANTLVDSKRELKGIIQNNNFHEQFHHSEQAIMHYLSSEEGIKSLAKTAKREKMTYLYGLVVDIYTHQRPCCHCTDCINGMQHSRENGFLFDLSAALKKRHIEPRAHNRLMLNTRVSASTARTGSTLDDLRLPNDKGIVHEYEYHPDKSNYFFQANNKTLGRKKIIKKTGYTVATKETPKKNWSNTYTGAFFVSQTFSKAKLEQNLSLSDSYTRKVALKV